MARTDYEQFNLSLQATYINRLESYAAQEGISKAEGLRRAIDLLIPETEETQTMAQYQVEVKNITANVDKMTVPQGETRTVTVRAADETQALKQAVKQCFDGCRFIGDTGIRTNDGSRYGQITTGKMLYGRIYVYVHPNS